MTSLVSSMLPNDGIPGRYKPAKTHIQIAQTRIRFKYPTNMLKKKKKKSLYAYYILREKLNPPTDGCPTFLYAYTCLPSEALGMM